MVTYRQDPVDRDSVAWTIMHEPWFERLNELGKRWVSNSEENKSAYESQMCECMTYIYMGCMQAAAGKYDEGVCDKAFEFVLSDMKNYDPSKQSLAGYVSYHVHNRLKDAFRILKDKEPDTISIDDDSNGPSTVGGITICPIDENEAAQAVIVALALNFASLKNETKREQTQRHYQMFYTEQLTGAAQIVPLPEKWKKDILNALHEPYFRYFIANVADTEPITLRTIEYAIPKTQGEVIPGKSMDARLNWNHELFLPVMVQICYLEKMENVQVSPAAITTLKNRYRTFLQKNCKAYLE